MVGQDDGRVSAPVTEGLLQRFHEAPAVAGTEHQPVLHHGETASGRRIVELLDGGDALGSQDANEAGAEQTLAHLRPGQPVGQCDVEHDQRAGVRMRFEERCGRALGAVAGHRDLAVPAVRDGDLGEQQLQVVVQLGHRADGGA